MITYNNLKIEATRRCTFKCAHCEKGPASGKDLQSKFLPKIFTEDTIIRNLELDGGDVLLAYDVLDTIVDFIIQSKCIVLGVNISTNGTYFGPRSERVLSKLRSYVTKCQSYIGKYSQEVSLILSADEYHKVELESVKEEDPWLYKIYLESIQELINSSYFSGKTETVKVINKGRAENLSVEKYYPPTIETYYLQNGEDILISNASVLVDGTVENTNASLFDDTLSSIILKNGVACTTTEDFQNGCEKNEYSSKNLVLINEKNN